MRKENIIRFFDSLASEWDANQTRNENAIAYILDVGGASPGKCILDVACGTGVLFDDYISRGVEVTGIDISSAMTEKAKEKYPEINIICGDAESYAFNEKFDAVMVYNAFPHFTEPSALFRNLSEALVSGGRFTVAHGISEAELALCHSGSAKDVSLPLPSKEALSEMMSDFFRVDVAVSDDEKYIVSGIKL